MQNLLWPEIFRIKEKKRIRQKVKVQTKDDTKTKRSCQKEENRT